MSRQSLHHHHQYQQRGNPVSSPSGVYDQSVGSTTAESASWSSRSGQQYGYFPKSHPKGVVGGNNVAPLTRTQSAATASSSIKGQLPMADQMMSSGGAGGGPPPSMHHSSYAGGDQQSWASSPPTSTSRMQHYNSQQYHHQVVNPSNTSLTSSPTSAQYSRTPHGSPTASPDGGGLYRNDYSRSQHPGAFVERRANSEPIQSEQDRFAAYVNRFAQVDPRTSVDYRGRQQQQQHVQQQQQHAQHQTQHYQQQQQQAYQQQQQQMLASPNPNYAQQGEKRLSLSPRVQQHQHPPPQHSPRTPRQQPHSRQQHQQGMGYPDPEPDMEQLEARTPLAGSRRGRLRPPEVQSSSGYSNMPMSSNAEGSFAQATPPPPPPQQFKTPTRGRQPRMMSSNNGPRGKSAELQNRGKSVERGSARTPSRSHSPGGPHRNNSNAALNANSNNPTMVGVAKAPTTPSRERSNVMVVPVKPPSEGPAVVTTNDGSTGSAGRSTTPSHQQGAPNTPNTTRPAIAGHNGHGIQHSPGTHRTRDLARRFEQRMISKGRSSQLQSAMQSAYQHQQQPSEVVPQSAPATTTVVEQTPSTPVRPDYSKAKGEIETPSPAKVQELKEKLWDADESLQVKVKPSVHADENKHLNRHWLHFNGPEMGRGRIDETPSLQPSEEVVEHAAPRQVRSLSPRTPRKAYDATVISTPPPSQHYNFSTTVNQASVNVNGAHMVPSSSDVASNSSNGNRFKSRFYEAAAVASPDWSPSGGEPRDSPRTQNQSHNSGGHRSSSAIEANAERQAALLGLHPGNKDVWLSSQQAGAPPVALSQATTVKQQNVSNLLAKLHAVNRDDPQRALAQIDAIIKAEAMSASSGGPSSRQQHVENKNRNAPERSSEPAQKQQNPDERRSPADDEPDSESETTVSSITNPTYQGHPRKDADESGYSGPSSAGHEELPARPPSHSAFHPTTPSRIPPKVAVLESDLPAFTPITSNIGGAAFQTASETRQRLGKSKSSRIPPPDTIRVAGGKEKPPKGSEGSSEGKAESKPMTPLEGKLSRAALAHRKANDDNLPSNASELAQKIRRWDELSCTKDSASNASRGKQNENCVNQTTEEKSNATDELGSIVTPRGSVASPRRSHPWDATIPSRSGSVDVRETSMDDAAGVETHFSPTYDYSQPAAEMLGSKEERSGPSKSRTDPRPMLGFNDDFDDEWVALPSSRFFANNNSHNGNSASKATELTPRSGSSRTRRNERDEAVVEKFAPKELRSSRDVHLSYPTSPKMYDYPTEDDPNDSSFSGGRGDKSRRGLRGLLLRRKGSDPDGARLYPRGDPISLEMDIEEEAPPPEDHRGRRRLSSTNQSNQRSRSLEERRIRNPNIARKFSKMLRVYGEEERGHI